MPAPAHIFKAAGLAAPAAYRSRVRVQVTYNVPVIVVVDTDAGTVDRVVVSNEEIALDEVEPVRKHDDQSEVSDSEAQQAVDIAETDSWPAWDQGF
jgi:hypothetical protein